MSEPFSEKLALVLKAVSMSRARLAADLGVHKSVVGRWVTGAVTPSAHNLSRLSALMAEKVSGFAALDWERDLKGLAALFGIGPGGFPAAHALGARGDLPLALLGQTLALTARTGGAYEGFYRSTRPYAGRPGRFLHDHCMVRRDDNGFLRLSMASGGVFVDGWVLPLHDQLFVIGAEFTSSALVFGILHGTEGRKAEVLDGLTLSPILDGERTLTASAFILQRIGDLSGDIAADDARFTQLAAVDSLAPEGSIPETLRGHLTRDIGPAQLAAGGDWLLRAPRSRSLSSAAADP